MDERALLEHYRPWLRRCAAGMTRPDWAEDLAQEGWIALWRASATYDGSAPLDWWLKRKAHGRMLTCVQRNWRSQKAVQDVPRGLPQVPEGEDTDDVWTALSVDLGAVELAYHRGDVYRAVDALSPREREYVFLRFWCGWKLPQMREHFGYEPSGLWRRAKSTLRTELAELMEIA